MRKQDSPKSVVYGFCDPKNGQIRYVGKATKWLSIRVNGHRRSAHLKDRNGQWMYRTRFYNWYRSVIKAGEEPECFVLDTVPVEKLAECERFWIETLKFLGANLTNLTTGGDGCVGYRHTDASKLKMRKIEDRSAVVGLYLSGESSEEIASKYGVSGSQILRILSDEGVKARTGGPRRRLTEEQETSVVADYRQPGVSSLGLAVKYGVTDTTIRNVLQRHRVTRKSVGRSLGEVKCSNGKVYASAEDAARSLGLDSSAICKCLRNTAYSVKGYRFTRVRPLME